MGNRLVSIGMTIGLAILTVVGSVEFAWAEKRIALAIGNSNYTNVPKLPNPSRDAIAIGQMFRDVGFDGVDVIVNANIQELKRALRKFANDVDQADVAVIYYAGHGLEISGVNYIIPVDAKLASDGDAERQSAISRCTVNGSAFGVRAWIRHCPGDLSGDPAYWDSSKSLGSFQPTLRDVGLGRRSSFHAMRGFPLGNRLRRIAV